MRLAERMMGIFHSARFRVYTATDVAGVELGGALKNVIAIGAGIGDGLGAGDNAKAAFITRGIAEITRLGVASGADVLTFAGLSGIGDLIATCASPLSRNHRVGAALAQGQRLEAILAGMGEVAEGVPTTRAALELGKRHGVELPIVEQMHRVLFDGVAPTEAIQSLMAREPTDETMYPNRTQA
jgi:glycerol-3-phosphate dehydrogenase (NAD(P)+)